MTAPTVELFAPEDLTAATDVDLDHALARLYLLHAEADQAGRDAVHPRIMQIVGEMRVRTEGWLSEHGADASIAMADRQTVIHAVISGRSPEPQAIELIKTFHKAGADINSIALVNHGLEIRGGTALHFAVRKRQKEVIKELASLGIDMDAVDQDGLTALDYTQSRGFMPFMALQTPVFKEEAALLRELGATKMMARSPEWPVLGPPQGVWADIWPLGESKVHEPVYKPIIR